MVIQITEVQEAAAAEVGVVARITLVMEVTAVNLMNVALMAAIVVVAEELKGIKVAVVVVVVVEEIMALAIGKTVFTTSDLVILMLKRNSLAQLKTRKRRTQVSTLTSMITFLLKLQVEMSLTLLKRY